MTIAEIIKAFTYVKKCEFPLDAMNEAVQRQEEITPALLEYIQKSPAEIYADVFETGNDEEANFLWEFSIFLLAQFREESAFPYIVNFFSHKDQKKVDGVAGEFVTESLPSVLASVYNGDLDRIFEVINTESIDAFIRGSFLKATVILIFHGKLNLDDLRERYISLFTKYSDEQDVEITTHLVTKLSKLADPALRPYIDDAFAKNLVDKWMIGKDGVNNYYNNPPKRNDRFFELIDDPHKEMKGWVWFSEKKSIFDISDSIDSSAPELKPVKQPVYVDQSVPKIGRNEPCPCGSGKKYKKCCLFNDT